MVARGVDFCQNFGMKKTDYWLKWFLPGIVFILLAFWAGTLQSAAFAFIGFLSFFVIGVTLIVEGAKKSKKR